MKTFGGFERNVQMLGLFKSKVKAEQARILLVDDEPDLVDTIQCRLEANNFDVIIACNGQEGLGKAVAEKPDLILLDTSMPVMNGHEMLDQLRKHPEGKDIPVIMCTAMCEPRDVAKASAYDIADYVTKPFDCTELIEKITKALESRKSG
ncbi:MAG: response regulator [Planctomycetota bacterium]|nr:response regulator [Planctomycetota bacterium]